MGHMKNITLKIDDITNNVHWYYFNIYNTYL
jgi:hypothetical protein